MTSFEKVIAILDAAVGGPDHPVGVHQAFWRGKTRDQLVAEVVLGKQLIKVDVPEESALIHALKGEGDFDGTPFNRMPSGGNGPVSAADIQFISDWIAAGCPADEVIDPAPPEPPTEPPGQPAHVAHPINPSSLGGKQVVYRIHPAVGIARLGNSTAPGDEGWFVGPEVPGEDFLPAPDGKYRDSQGNIRRQGARFRVYEYTYHSPNDPRPPAVREVTSTEADISWHVHLANNKTFTRDPAVGDRISIPNDAGCRTVSGVNQEHDIVTQLFAQPIKLGTLKTDDQGRLIVLGGHGMIDTSTGVTEDGLFWPDWCDDVADGSVRATIKLKETGQMPAVQSSWVVTGVPAFAAPIESIVTLHDLALDVAVRHHNYPLPQYVSFTHDIYPVLRRAVRMKWVSASARAGHGTGKGGDFLNEAILKTLASNDSAPGCTPRNMRESIFSRVTYPGDVYGGDMPGLNFLTLTAHQYACFTKWRDGDFLNDWQGVPKITPFEELDPLGQTVSLDTAHLAGACGGGFMPGVEVSYEINSPHFWERPFRINTELAPGSLTRALSVPWQVDFSACGWGWWPGSRPNATTTDGENWQYWVRLEQDKHLVTEWWKQGFLTKKLVDGVEMVVEGERIE